MDANAVIGIAAIVVAAAINADRGRILDRLKRLEDGFESIRKQTHDDKFELRIDRLERRSTPRGKPEWSP